jgi:uncharacterized Zn-binding protein involved in type VI secretion
MRVDGTGTMPSSYGGTDTIKIALRRRASGALEGFVTLVGTTKCASQSALKEYHACTPATPTGWVQYGTLLNDNGIHAATNDRELASATATKVGPSEVALAFKYAAANGEAYGFTIALKNSPIAAYAATQKVVLQNYSDAYLRCGTAVDSVPTHASSTLTHYTLTKVSGTGAAKVGDQVTIRCANGKYITRSGSGVVANTSVTAASRWVLEGDNQAAGTAITLGTTRVHLVADNGSRLKDRINTVGVYSGTGASADWTLHVPAQADPGN